MMIKKPFLKTLICLALFIIVSSCSNSKKFDRQKWSYGDGLNYPLRDNIVDNLLKTHLLKGMAYRQVIDTLGSPQNRDTLQLSYQIIDNSSEYNRKKPIHKKNLILYFNKDSVVVKAEVYDHTNKK
jgi:outer membrane protein assembly factor BamE (lipoprotein component of BamABCDE complex)